MGTPKNGIKKKDREASPIRKPGKTGLERLVYGLFKRVLSFFKAF